MKRSVQIEIITAVIMIVTSLASPAGAEILWSGDVIPSDPSTWTSITWGYIGKTGYGTMGITGGSDVIDEYGFIGYDPGSTGAVTVDGSGSTWTNNSGLRVGRYGNGTLNITGGGAVSNSFSHIGLGSGTTGVVTVNGSGSTWINNEDLLVGLLGDGTVNITGGGAVSSDGGVIGLQSGSTGAVTVDGANSSWTNNRDLCVGFESNGTLNITDGGLVSVGDKLTIGNIYNGGDGFINMATGGMLALLGEADDSLVEFLGLIEGTGAVRYWDSSIADWADITGATLGLDYTLEYLTDGDLTGYTMLTVPEPATMLLLGLGGLVLRRRKSEGKEK